MSPLPPPRAARRAVRPPQPCAVLVALALLFVLGARTAAADKGASPRVIVLGFDGADARTVAELMDQGQLPALARLRSSGTFAPLGTTTPAESPVSWASLNSGQNPAKTGIPGFVMRKLGSDGSPTPDLGHQVHGPRATHSFALNPLHRLLVAHDPLKVGALCGAASFVVFAALFALLLRMRKWTAFALAFVLGAAGAVGGRFASQLMPRSIDEVVGNPTKVGGFWEVAARAGVPCVVIDAAMAWDREPVAGARVLAGLGVPDVRGSNGDWFVYTTDPKELAGAPDGRATSTGGTVFSIDERDGRIDSAIFGPKDIVAIDVLRRELDALQSKLREQPAGSAARALQARADEIEAVELPALTDAHRLSVPLSIEKPKQPGGKARVSIDGQPQELAEGEWSQWYHPSFECNVLIKSSAVTRVKILHMDDPFTLYVDFLQIDPRSAPFWQAISQPAGFGNELAKAIGQPYETVGWACMTMPFKDREIDPVTFLQDLEFTANTREKLLLAALARGDWRLLMHVESTPDRAQHMLYQFYDKQHPLYDAQKAAQKVRYFSQEITLADAIPATYRQMDRLVGKVVAQLAAGDTLIICADHGFQSFRRGVDLNNWLVEHGYLKLREGVRGPKPIGLDFVDWRQTQAYAIGLGMIFLNLEGRERDGIVSAAQAPAVLAKLRSELLAMVDPQTNTKAVRSVYTMSDIHHGDYLALEADLMPGFEATYRVSWDTTLGGIRLVQSDDKASWIAGPVFSDNKNNWSGDHVSVAEDLVRGAFFCNRKVELPADGIDLLHIAPTALSLLGVKVPAEYDRPPLTLGN